MVPCFYLPGVVVTLFEDKRRNQHWACVRLLFEAHGRFTPCKWPLIRCIKTILFRRIPQVQSRFTPSFQVMKVPTLPKSNYITTHHKQKEGLYWQVRIHTKRQTLEKLMTKSRGVMSFCFADSALKRISHFMDWSVNWFMDSSIFSTEPDARNAQKRFSSEYRRRRINSAFKKLQAKSGGEVTWSVAELPPSFLCCKGIRG